MCEFTSVADKLKSIADVSGANDKQALIKEYSTDELFCKVVRYALDPYKMYNMTGNIPEDGQSDQDTDFEISSSWFFDKLDIYSSLRGLSQGLKDQFFDAAQYNGSDCALVMNRILNKDLRIGAGVKSFRKACPEVFGSLPSHHPMKGYSDLEAFLKYCAKNNTYPVASPKLDGTRCWAVCNLDYQTSKYLSFNGKDIENFQVLNDEVLEVANRLSERLEGTKNTPDGEVINVNGGFDSLMSEFRRLENMDDSGFRFRLFDFVPEKGSKFENLTLTERMQILDECVSDKWECSQGKEVPYKVSTMEVLHLKEPEQQTVAYILELLNKYIHEYGEEGLMLKAANSVYEHKKSTAWCKVKEFHTEDIEVIGTVEGTGKHKGVLGALMCLYKPESRKPVEVKVGTGFSDEQRIAYWKSPPAMIEVSYQEVTAAGSLRFPSFVRVRDDKSPEEVIHER